MEINKFDLMSDPEKELYAKYSGKKVKVLVDEMENDDSPIEGSVGKAVWAFFDRGHSRFMVSVQFPMDTMTFSGEKLGEYTDDCVEHYFETEIEIIEK